MSVPPSSDESADPGSTMVDLAFTLTGLTLPHGHRQPLAAALERELPWLPQTPGAGMHRLNLSQGGDGQALLSQRTRLLLRVPRDRVADALRLQGQVIDLFGHRLQLGPAQVRELLPWGSLYAHVVASLSADEGGFMLEVEVELRRLGLRCRPICGRRQALETDDLQGYSLMLDGLSAADSLGLLQRGIGPPRRLGCGLFVPHRSAAAVGARQ